MPDTPADELRAAAATLRQQATAASTDARNRDTSTWTSHHVNARDARLYGPDHTALLHGGSSGPHGRGTHPHLDPRHADYIATMHPGVGTALADWLNAEADRLDVTAHPGWQETVASPHALTIARAINQEQT